MRLITTLILLYISFILMSCMCIYSYAVLCLCVCVIICSTYPLLFFTGIRLVVEGQTFLEYFGKEGFGYELKTTTAYGTFAFKSIYNLCWHLFAEKQLMAIEIFVHILYL